MKDPMVLMAREHYAPYRWVQAPIAFLGLWLLTAPAALRYESPALAWSDIISGAVALLLAFLALSPRRGWASWAQSLVGLWLLFAPLAFWAPSPSAYANDTLVGALLVTFGLLVPMAMKMEGPATPPGWSYNPSTWPQRAPVITLAVVSFFAARYMAARQLGYIDSAWDPFFGPGTDRVLTSDVSRAWPVSDAGLGAMTYLVEALSGFMGDKRRWRTMPWMVAVFGFAVVPLGIVSIVLVILQPLSVGDWCTLCLFSAALMLAMIPLSLDEIVAMVQFVLKRRREGVSAWRTFWLGGQLSEDASTHIKRRPETWHPRGMLWGVTASWPLLLAAGIGIWLMFAPAVLGTSGTLADSDHLVGALIVVWAVIAMAEVGRPARYLNLVLGGWPLVATWFLDGGAALARWNDAASGVAVIVLSAPLGKIRDRYGAFDRYVRWKPRVR